jgi:hypothetical protein
VLLPLLSLLLSGRALAWLLLLLLWPSRLAAAAVAGLRLAAPALEVELVETSPHASVHGIHRGLDKHRGPWRTAQRTADLRHMIHRKRADPDLHTQHKML